MLVIDDPRRHVAPAAKGLDQLWPGWEHNVDLEALDMRSCSLCVLGQIGYAIHDGKQSDFEWINIFRQVWMFLIDNKLCPDMVEGVFSDNFVLGEWIKEIEARRTPWQEELDASRAALVHA